MLRTFRLITTLVLAVLPLAACVVYEPVPMYATGPRTFDRAWTAAYGAVQDVGVQVISADPDPGLIRGTKDGINVTVSVARQADGSVRVQFDATGATQRDPGLAERFSRAYELRRGR